MQDPPQRKRRRRAWKGATIAVASLCGLLTIPFHLCGEELVLHEFVAKTPDRNLERVLYLAAGIELMREGLSSTKVAKAEDYILLTEYSASHGSLTIHYRLVRPEAPKRTLASAEATIPIDQELDEKIGVVIEGLLRRAGIKATPSRTAHIEGLLPGVPAAAVPQASPPRAAQPTKAPRPIRARPIAPLSPSAPSPTGPLPPPPAEVSATPSLPPSGKAATHSTTGPAIAVAGTPRGRRLRLAFDSSVSAAGVLFFGQMTEYFHYGLAGLAAAGVVRQWKSSRFGVAARLSFIRVLNDVGVNGGPLYLSTAGLSLQYGTGSENRFRVAVAASGGAAVITVASPGRTMATTAPYADLGLSGTFPIGRHFSLGEAIRFLAIFDKGLLILGAVPAVTLSIGP